MNADATPPGTPPELPEPDDKDWTWTLRQRCPECGFDASTTRVADVAALVEDVLEQFRRRLADPDATTRPQPAVWSTTEYACHVRDVCELFAQRLRSMLDEDDPLFANWDQDRTAQEKQYWREQPALVAAELAAAGAEMLTLVRGVGAEDEARPGRRSNGSAFTVETFLQYFAHDLVHHAHDIRVRD